MFVVKGCCVKSVTGVCSTWFLNFGQNKKKSSFLALGGGLAGSYPNPSFAVSLANGPPGTELAYVEFTSDKVATSSTESSAVTVVSAGAFTFDGATKVRLEFFCPSYAQSDNSNGIILTIFDGTTSTVIGKMFESVGILGAQVSCGAVFAVREFTPSAAAHTYFVGILDYGSVTTTHATVHAGAGGSGTYLPGFVRIIKV